jgi:HAD superfamily hydrolase (TIGR01549 family)
MNKIKVVSFDVEGTLATPAFSHALWHETIPALYASKKEIDIAQAEAAIFAEYGRIGKQQMAWYDIEHWFEFLQLGDPQSAIQSCLHKVKYYPEVEEVLASLSTQYKLCAASGMPLNLLRLVLQDIEHYFTYIFSAPTHYKQLKSPAFYRGICAEMGVHPAQVAHTGDSWQFDFLNPGQAGIHAFYLDRQGKNQESLSDLRQLQQQL